IGPLHIHHDQVDESVLDEYAPARFDQRMQVLNGYGDAVRWGIRLRCKSHALAGRDGDAAFGQHSHAYLWTTQIGENSQRRVELCRDSAYRRHGARVVLVRAVGEVQPKDIDS